MKKISSISIIFPLFKDRKTVKKMILKSQKALKRCGIKNNEIVIVDDGCPENSGHLAKKISRGSKNIKVIFHRKNLGYGAAIKTGLKNCKYDWIFQTDGDNEYDVFDLLKLIKKTEYSDLVVTYRLKKKYKTSRIVISWVYNKILRILFHTNFKDISTGSRLIKRSILNNINLISNSPFLGAELAIKSKYQGYNVSEVGINTYPRTFGSGSSVTLKNILLTIKEMLELFVKIKI